MSAKRWDLWITAQDNKRGRQYEIRFKLPDKLAKKFFTYRSKKISMTLRNP